VGRSPSAKISTVPLLVVCLSVLALGAIAQQVQLSPGDASPDHDGRGAIAILRRDGLLVPFASFDRDSWRVTWPVHLAPQIEIPLTRAAIPTKWWGTRWPDQWRAYLASGDEMFLRLEDPTVFRGFCGRMLGVRTAYRSKQPLPPMPVNPFPKDGLAISGGVPLESIESVSPSSPEWAALPTALLEKFNELEDRTISQVRTFRGWRHPTPAGQRRAIPIRLESWYRSPSGQPGWTVSYVEVVRQYPPRPEDKGCGLETFVSGWVHHRDGKLAGDPQLSARLTYCDRVGVTYMLPFGRIRPRDKTYWVFQLSGWETEWYDVVEVRPKMARFVLEVFAGSGRGCR
jgi:hypothetical protein